MVMPLKTMNRMNSAATTPTERCLRRIAEVLSAIATPRLCMQVQGHARQAGQGLEIHIRPMGKLKLVSSGLSESSTAPLNWSVNDGVATSPPRFSR